MAEHSEQAKLEEDPVSIKIGEKLKFSLKSPDRPCISRVPNYLRQVNGKAYGPQVISIGPYYRHWLRSHPMENQKIYSLQMLLKERNENNVSAYVQKMRTLKDEALKCYDADYLINHDPDDFVEMLLLDGVFIVQTIRLFLDQEFPPVLSVALHQDMLLVDNQLPYFVLWELFCMIENRPEAKANQYKFRQAIFFMLISTVPGKVLVWTEVDLSRTFKHLFDFMYKCWWKPLDNQNSSEMESREENPRDNLNSSVTESRKENPPDDRNCLRLCIKHLLSCWCQCCCHPENNEMKFCATELQEAGIKFKLFEEENSRFDIRFENGTLHIPEIIIEGCTDKFLLNLVAYKEMFLKDEDPKPASDYMIFMDRLINTPKDVEILCKERIIRNMLIDDQAAATMINGLGQANLFHYPCSYTKVFKEVKDYCDRPLNKHCRRRWKRWMVNLKQNYFNSPWSLISVLAAAVLLILTVLQTIFSAK